MIEEGQFIVKNGIEYCLLSKIKFEGTKYYLFSAEKNNNLDFTFYTLKEFNPDEGVKFEEVEDPRILSELFSIVEEKIKY